MVGRPITCHGVDQVIGSRRTALNEDGLIALDEFHSLFRGDDFGIFVGNRVEGFGRVVPKSAALRPSGKVSAA